MTLPTIEIIQLHNTDYTTVATFAQSYAEFYKCRMGLDTTTGAILLAGSSAEGVDSLKQIIETLDNKLAPVATKTTKTTPKPKKSIKLYPFPTALLKYDLHRSIESSNPTISMMVDPIEGYIKVTGTPDQHKQVLDSIDTLIKEAWRFDEQQPSRKPIRRLVIQWLVTQPQEIDNAKPAPINRNINLQPIFDELKRHGITNLQLEASTMVSALLDQEFELNTTVSLPNIGDCELTIKGLFEKLTGELKISITGLAKSKTEKDAYLNIAGIQTKINAPLGHQVILGATPLYDQTSVFVITIYNTP